MPSSSVAPGTDREVTLRVGQIRALHLPAGARVTVLTGIVWLTQQNDLEDHVLGAGEFHATVHAGRIVLQSLRGDAVVAVDG